MGKTKAILAMLIFAGFAFTFTLPNIFGQKTQAEESRNLTIYAPATQATIFSNNLALVSRYAEADIGKGNYNIFLQNLTSAVSLETISVRDDKGGITQIRQYNRPVTAFENNTRDLTFEELLNRSTGKEITIVTKSGAKTATLRWHDPERIGVETKDGTAIIKIADIEELTTPVKEYSKTEETNTTTSESGLMFSEKSATAGKHQITATYLVQGATWGANYKYYIEEEAEKGSGTLQAWAKVTNNAEDWDNINLQVVVGYPRTINYNPPAQYAYARYYAEKSMVASSGAPSVEPQFAAAQVTDYYVYELKNAVSIKKGEEQQISLFENTVEYVREYAWDTSWKMPRKTYKLTNKGTESWASGALRVYLKGGLLGEDQITYTPTGKTADAYIADVPDIVGDKTMLSTETEQAGKSRITTYRMNITAENNKKEKIDLKITETMAGGDKVEVLDSTIPPASRTGNTLEWKISLAPGQAKEILYTYRVTNQYYY